MWYNDWGQVNLNSKLSAAGLKRNMTFVIYDNTSASFGAAGRIFWMLEYLGCKKVHILDGGWDKWVEDGRPTQSGVNTLPAAKFKASVKKSRITTKEQIEKKLGRKNFAIVDSRTDEEYNGWQLYGEARGGHIPGAVQIPYEWFFNPDKTVLDYNDLKTMFESRGITRNKKVTAYCTLGIRSGFVYFLYRLMGYPKASNYDGSMVEWAADDSLPMEKMAEYQKLVYPGWVKSLIDEGNHGDPFVIVETGWGSADASGYNNGHIPGAIHVNTDEIEYDTFPARNSVPADQLNRSTTAEEDLCKGLTPDDSLPRNWWNIYPDQYLLPAIACMGIDKDTTVVVYGKSASAAARVIWTLMYAGVKDVRLLNGGLKAWTAAGYDVETTAVARKPVASFGASQALHPEYLVNTDYILQVSNNPDSVSPPAAIVDIRSWDEYTGASSPYSYIPTLGRIPGAVWGHNSGDLMDAIDGTLRSYPEVAQMWQDSGITPDKRLSFY
jgi:3-mercaptopyruvate sulfurtransferase SseA